MLDLTLQQILFRIVGFLLVAGVHGLAVAATARWLGDEGPRHDGKLTANPAAHVDLLGGLVFVVWSLGWFRPIALDPGRLRHGRLGLCVIVLVTTLVTLMLALVLRLSLPLVAVMPDDSLAATAAALTNSLARSALWLGLLNLLPIPPLTGGHLLLAAFPALAEPMRRAGLGMTAIVAALIVSGAAGWLLRPAYRYLAVLLLDEDPVLLPPP